MAKRESSDADDMDRINEEFDSLVSGLSLDESSPTTYLDELESRKDSERFIAPHIARKKFSIETLIRSLRSARHAIERWKNNRGDYDGDGAQL